MRLLTLGIMLATLIGCSSTFHAPGVPPQEVENAARAEMNDQPFLGRHLEPTETRTEEGLHLSWKQEDWLELWKVTIWLTVIPFEPEIDVWVRSDGDGGTELEVRQRELVLVFFVVPILLSSDEAEDRIAEEILKRARARF